jgi:hypothetical protein
MSVDQITRWGPWQWHCGCASPQYDDTTATTMEVDIRSDIYSLRQKKCRERFY